MEGGSLRWRQQMAEQRRQPHSWVAGTAAALTARRQVGHRHEVQRGAGRLHRHQDALRAGPRLLRDVKQSKGPQVSQSSLLPIGSIAASKPAADRTGAGSTSPRCPHAQPHAPCLPAPAGGPRPRRPGAAAGAAGAAGPPASPPPPAARRAPARGGTPAASPRPAAARRPAGGRWRRRSRPRAAPPPPPPPRPPPRPPGCPPTAPCPPRRPPFRRRRWPPPLPPPWHAARWACRRWRVLLRRRRRAPPSRAC